MSDSLSITPTGLLASASRLLEAGGYQAIRKDFAEWNTSSTRLFEDEYGIVGLAVFATCKDLLSSWPALQGSLVDAISLKLRRVENKAWDGYLVLLTPGLAPSGDSDIEDI